MTELIKAYQLFWEEAGIPAYPGNNVPNDAEMPFITYAYAAADFAEHTILQSFLWTKAKGSISELARLTGKVFEMIPAKTGRVLLLEGGKGAVSLFRGAPWMQDYPQEDKDVKSNYFVVEVATYIN